MAPFLLNHPALINNWIAARETALARVRAVRHPSAAEVAQFRALLARARVNAATWRSEHPGRSTSGRSRRPSRASTRS
jgi:hypothetical protein